MKYLYKTILILTFIVIAPQSKATFEILPEGVQLLIFAQPVLDEKDLCSCALVNHNLNRLASSDKAWERLKPEFSIELLNLLITHCPSLNAFYELKFSKEKIANPTIMIQCGLRKITLAEPKEIIKKEIMRLANNVRASIGFIVDEATPQNIKKSIIHIPDEKFLNYFMVFIESFAEDVTEQYISNLANSEIPKNINELSVFEQNEIFKKVLRIHDCFSRLGSKAAQKSRNNFLEVMKTLGLNAD